MCDDATIRDLLVRTNTEWFQRYAGPPMSQGLIDELSARLLCWHVKQFNDTIKERDSLKKELEVYEKATEQALLNMHVGLTEVTTMLATALGLCEHGNITPDPDCGCGI